MIKITIFCNSKEEETRLIPALKQVFLDFKKEKKSMYFFSITKNHPDWLKEKKFKTLNEKIL